ncbi:MAG: RNB domain-containing ribonuclease, partial [Erysipelotrichia bacterium]|nr:RNB domain-containing ribonuclease [Erysipelotrichia bacterium]
MNYTQMILDVMSSNKYKGYDMERWKTYFSIESSKELTALVKSLNILEEEYIVLKDKKERYFTLAQMDCIVGTIRINPKGFGFVENEETSVYANRGEIKKALDGDEVLAKVINNSDGTCECEILKVIKHSKKTIIGVIKKREKRTWFLPDTDMGEHKFKITNLKDFKLVNDTKVQLYIERYGTTLECSILQILGHKYDPGIDILSILLEHDIEPTFPKGVMREVNQIEENISAKEKEGRLDLTNEMIITIDGDDSKDLDDAIHVKKITGGYQLG